jgi:hypothetical protein
MMPTTSSRFGVTARAIQIGLGVIWLFDGILQLQPKMFGPAFANQVIRPNASGQPGLVSSTVAEMARVVSVHPAASNWIFALVQILIGIGLLGRATVRPALLLSFVWAVGVWCFGEGFGMLFTGTASPLSGAPGAVSLYILIGVLAWPRLMSEDRRAQGRSACAAGPLGEVGGRVIWAALWLGMAGLWLLPANHGPDGVEHSLLTAAGSSPAWLAHLQTWVAGVVHGEGVAVSVTLAVVSLLIGIGPMISRRATVFLIAGAALSIDYWVLGQSFGGITTGLATDPNAGPLFVLLALALFPNGAPALRPTSPESSRRLGSVADSVGRSERTLMPV